MSRKLIYCSLISILLIITLLCLFIVSKPKKKSDAVKFKEEFEKYNDSSNVVLNIDESNPFVYRDEKEIEKILRKNTGMIYLGNPTDDDSRKVLKTILKLAKENDVNKIYYVNTKNVESKKIKNYINKDICIIFVIAGEETATFTNAEFSKMAIMGRSIPGEVKYYMQQTFNEYCDETCDD